MCCLDAVAVGKLDEDSVGGWLNVSAWAVDAKKVGGAAQVVNRSRVDWTVGRGVES